MNAQHVIGIMSGSSLDGLDMALCRFEETSGQLNWEIIESVTIPYSSTWYHSLRTAPSMSGFDLMKLDAVFGEFIGHEVKIWMSGKNWNVDYVASHGHTVFHEPALGFTTQIGSGAHIAEQCCIDTITNFRNADVARNGQGAPFAPAADRALWPGYGGYLNLGGIVNIFLITEDNRWLAWDVGPCNQALNFLARKSGQEYDHGGMLASKGAVMDAIRHDLVAMFPFHGGYPKSLSNAQVQNTWIEYLDLRKEDPLDLQTTTTLAIADMITTHISAIAKRPSRIMVTGGGVHNDFLMDVLRKNGTDIAINFEVPAQQIIDHKESVLIAYLGYLTANNKPFGIHPLTGASGDCIGGALHKAVK